LRLRYLGNQFCPKPSPFSALDKKLFYFEDLMLDV
jgi:hypothetical protein